MTSGGGELEGVERFVVRSSGVSGLGGLKSDLHESTLNLIFSILRDVLFSSI